MSILKISDDVEAVLTPVIGVQYRAVDPLTRIPTGPLRRNKQEAHADDDRVFVESEENKQKNYNPGVSFQGANMSKRGLTKRKGY